MMKSVDVSVTHGFRWDFLLILPITCISVVLGVPISGGTWWPIAAWGAFGMRLHVSSDEISQLALRDGSWTNTQWAASAVMSMLWQSGGVDMLLIGAMIVATVSATSIFLVFRKWHIEQLPAIAALVLVMSLLSPFQLQGQSFALACACLLALTLVGGRPWLAPIVLLAWANLHPSSVYGLAMCSASLWGASDLAPRAPARRSASVIWLAACFGATLINPIGVTTHLYVLRVRSVEGLRYVTHAWEPLSLSSSLALLLAVITAAALYGAGRAGRSKQALPLIVLILMATFVARRNSVWLAPVAAPWVALGMQGAWSEAQMQLQLGKRMIALIGTGLLVCLLLVIGPGMHAWNNARSTGVMPDSLIAAIPRGERVFASAIAADQLYIERHAKVFIDMRFERYRDSDLKLYGDVSDGKLFAIDNAFSCGDGDPTFPWMVTERSQQRKFLSALRHASDHQLGNVRFTLVAASGPWRVFHVACTR